MNQALDNFEIWVCKLFFEFVNWCNKIAFDYFAIINVLLIGIGLITFINIAVMIFKSKNKKISLFKIDKFIILKNNLVVDTLKIAIVIIAIITISSFIDFYKFKVIGIFFNQYITSTILFCIIWYIGRYKILNKFRNKYSNSEFDYLEMIHNYLLFLLFFSSLFGIKYIIVNILGIYIITEIIHYLNISNEFNIKDNEESLLYEVRKGQLIDFHNILNKKMDDNYAVALNGEWGSGKTVFLKEYMKKYDSENFYIYIKPLITDSIESLIGQISSQLTNILCENEFNLNRKKLIKKYFNEIVKILGEKSKFSFNGLFEFDNYEDTYIDLKNKIQKNIDELKKVTEKKIIFIVDDFDRINEDNQETILDFIKEIVDFNNTITVFAFDWKKINGNKKINHEYLEKFVSYEIYLARISYKDILDEYGKNKIFNNLKEDSFIYNIAVEVEKIIYDEYSRLNKVKNEIADELKVLSKKPNDVKEDDYKSIINLQYKYMLKLIYNLNNSRRVITFLENINNTIKNLENKKYNTLEEEKISKLEISNLIYIMNFLKVFDNDIFMEIIEYESIEKYQDKLDSHSTRNSLTNLVRHMNNEKIVPINYDEESIAREGKMLYIKEVMTQKTKNFLNSSEIEIIKREKSKIFRDLFIDYNLIDNELNFSSKSEDRIKKLDELSNDININLLESDEHIFEQLQMYMKDILYEYKSNVIEKRLRLFLEYCVGKLINTNKLTVIDYLGLLESRNTYNAQKYIYLFERIFFENIDMDYKISKSYEKEISLRIYFIDELIRTDYIDVILNWVEAIVNKNMNLKEKTNYLLSAGSKNDFLYRINCILKDIDLSEINNLQGLHELLKNQTEIILKDKELVVLDVEKLNLLLEQFIKQESELENFKNRLKELCSKNYEERDIYTINYDDLIKYIINYEIPKNDNDIRKFYYSILKLREWEYQNLNNISTDNYSALIKNCVKIFELIKENELFNNWEKVKLSVNIQWLIDNYRKEESE